MSGEPEISVVIPVWNRAELLGRALASVLAQGFPSFEIVVADNGSSDGSAAVARATGDARVRVLDLQHRGVSAARNAGAGAARGRILTFLDSDDLALPGWLAALGGALGDQQIGMVCCGCVRRSPERETILRPEPLGPIFERRRGLFLAGTFAVRRELFQAVGGYAEGLDFAENTELAIRLVELCGERGLAVATLDQPLVVYHAATRRPPATRAAALARLEATRYLLERHAEKFAADPRVRALHRGVAGVCAARLGDWAEARGWFLAALRSHPLDLRHAARWLAALLPPLARRWWRPLAEGP